MIFQSRIDNHKFALRPTTRVFHPGLGVDYKRGLKVVFSGPTRLFNSEEAQQLNGWTDEERVYVEEQLLKAKAFGKEIFLAAGELSKLTDEQVALMRVKPKMAKKKCQQIWLENGEAMQCPNPPEAGRDFCHKHDPKTPKITRGSVEQK